MKRKISPLAVVVVAGAFGLSANPVWSQSDPRNVSKGDDTNIQQPSEKGNRTDLHLGSSPANEASSQNVKEIQEALKEKGYDPGPVDGILGPKTQAALRDFQQSSGLAVTGQIDDQTANQLKVDKNSAR